MIEGWEIERHETLLRRARHSGGFLDGPDGMKVRIKRQEFPYDIGIWNNLKQGMGTGNVSTSRTLLHVDRLLTPSRYWPGFGPFRHLQICSVVLILRQTE
jgi:hypothetical protein